MPSKKRKLAADEDVPVPKRVSRRETEQGGKGRGTRRTSATKTDRRSRGRAGASKGTGQRATKSTGSKPSSRRPGPKRVEKPAKPQAGINQVGDTRPHNWAHDPAAQTRAGAAAAKNHSFAYLTQKGTSAMFRSSPGGRTFPLTT